MRYRLLSLLALAALFTGCRHAAIPANLAPPDNITTASMHAHGLKAFWGKDIVQCDITIVFGGNTAVDATFTFEAHGPRARMDTKDGQTIIYDGKTCWVTPAAEADPRDRFHVLTWPWFVIAPYKQKGDGIHLSDPAWHDVHDQSYYTVLQTFAADEGDTPDDWYRLFIHPETRKLDAMAYIVTYGKSTEKANEKPSIMLYHDYESVDGVEFSTRYELYYWSEDKGLIGDDPKATGTVTNISFLPGDQADTLFAIPEGAKEVQKPQP